MTIQTVSQIMPITTQEHSSEKEKGMKMPKVILVPYPAQGHVTPMLQLAMILHKSHGFQSVIVTPEFIHHRIVSNIEVQDCITFMSIPDGLDVNEPRDFFTISHSMENHMPAHLQRLVSSLESGVACMVVDLLASWAIQVANDCNLPVAGFWPAMLATYNLITDIPDMISLGLISELGIPEEGTPCLLPGHPMLSTEDLPWLIGTKEAQESRFRFWIRTLNRSRALRRILVNSFLEESKDCRPEEEFPKVIQVGPLIGGTKNPSFWEEDRSCIDWLDNQKHDSVTYVSFGSWVGPIEEDMIKELGLGLEATGRPFIWVLGPTWRKGLPVGFLERVARLGKVVSWAPQKEVLQHAAVGCYITHCGWNSTMEAIQCGKRLLCYPVAGDQFVNSAYIVKVWGIGVKLHGMRRDGVETGVRRVMEEGGDIQQRVVEMKERVASEEWSSRTRASLTDFIDNLTDLCK